MSEISASDFASGGSSAGSGGIFGAIIDVDVKVSALNQCVHCNPTPRDQSSCRQILLRQIFFIELFFDFVLLHFLILDAFLHL